MMLDQQLLCSSGQVVNANGNSTDHIDGSVMRNLGAGEKLIPIVHISAKSGTTPTIQAKLVGADDAAFNSNKITLFDTGTISDPAVPTFLRMAIPSHAPKRYYRFEYTVGGTSPSFTVTAGLVADEQTTPMV